MRAGERDDDGRCGGEELGSERRWWGLWGVVVIEKVESLLEV